MSSISFKILNWDVVRRLEEDGDIVLPHKKVSELKDEHWNTKQMTSKVLHGILNGDSVQKIAKAMESCVGNNENSAIRNARTMFTSAENNGRLDSYKNLTNQGVVMKKEWEATPDDRTRPSHKDIDGEEQDIDKPFSNGCMFPGDGNGPSEEVWCCRCAMGSHFIGFRRADGSISRINDYSSKTSHEEQMQKYKKTQKKDARKTPIEKLQDAVGDSYEYHRINNNLNAVARSNLNADFFDVKLTKMDENVQNSFVNQFETLSSKYDTTVQSIKPMDKLEYLSHKDSFATTFHNYEVDSSTIIYNPVKVNDVERVKELVKNGYAVQIKEEFADKYIITHEFAHTLVDMETKLDKSRNWLGADYNKVSNVRKEISGIFSRYAQEIGTLEKAQKTAELDALTTFNEEAWKKATQLSETLRSKSISKYSLVNADEFMAECFTHAELGGAQNDYVDEVMTVINKYFRR